MPRTDLPSGPESQNFLGLESFNNAFASAANRLIGLFSNSERQRQAEAETRRNLSDPRRWVEAFGIANIFDIAVVPQRSTDTIRGRVFGARELLETMNAAERVEQFRRFMEDVLPENVRKSLAPGGLPAVPTEAQKTRILTTIALVLGLNSPSAIPGAPEPMLARIAFETIYPAAGPDGLGGAIYQDYLQTVEQIRQIGGTAGAPSPAQLGNRDELLKLLQERETRLPPGRYLRFLGWLRVEDPTIAQARLAAMGAQRQRGELAGEQITRKTNTLLEDLSRGPREDAERRNRTFLQNFGTLEPWQQYALIGVGLFAAWRLWKRPWLRAIPIGLLGLYVYRRLMVGDTDAMNTITGTIQGGVNAITDTGARLFNGGLLPRTANQVDRGRMANMARFFNQQAFVENFIIAAPMMTIAEVKMRNLASDNVFSATLAADNSIEYVFGTENEQHPLYLEVQGIIKRRRYDRETMHRIFHECNPQIAQGLGAVFYQLAARLPANRDRVRIIEEARQRDAGFSATGPANLSYDNIRDPAVKRMFIDLVTEGRVIALQQHPDENFVDLIQTFMNEGPERVEWPDNAERVEPPNLTPPTTRALQTGVREQPLNQNRDVSKKAILDDFNGFLDSCTAARFTILDAQARKILAEFAQQLLDDASKPLPDVLLILQRVRYAVLVGATARAGGSPLARADIEQIIGREGTDRTNFATVGESIGRFINTRIVTLSSGLNRIDNLASVKAILSERFFSGVESGAGGLSQLRKQITEHRARFNRLRNPDQAAQSFLDSITASDPAAVTRLGGRTQALAFFRHLTGSPDYTRFVDEGERYYAQRVANDIVTAQLTTHRANGNHELNREPGSRFISPTEEQNLIANNDVILREIIGLPNQPFHGMWAAMAMRQLLNDFRPDMLTFNNASVTSAQEREPERMQAVEHTRRLASLYLALQPFPPSATSPLGLPGGIALNGIDIALRSRVLTLAQKFLEDWNRHEAGIAIIRQEIQKVQSEIGTLNTQLTTIDGSITATESNIAKIAAVPALPNPALLALQAQLVTLQQQRLKIDAELTSKGVLLQNRIKFLTENQSQQKVYREGLLRSASYREGLRDVYSTMRLLNVDIVINPTTGRRLQQEIDAIINGPYLPGGPEFVPGATTGFSLSPGPTGSVEYLAPGAGPLALRLTPGPSGVVDLNLAPGAAIQISLAPGGEIQLSPGSSGIAFNVVPGASGSVTIPAGAGRPALTFTPGAGSNVVAVPGSGVVRMTPGPGGITISAGLLGPVMRLIPGPTPGSFDLVPVGANAIPVAPGSSRSFILNPSAGPNAIRLTPGPTGTMEQVTGSSDIRLTSGPGGMIALHFAPGASPLLLQVNSAGNAIIIPPVAGVTTSITSVPGGGNVLTVNQGGAVIVRLSVGASGTIVQPAAGQPITLTPGPDGIRLSEPAGAMTRTLIPGPSSTLIIRP